MTDRQTAHATWSFTIGGMYLRIKAGKDSAICNDMNKLKSAYNRYLKILFVYSIADITVLYSYC